MERFVVVLMKNTRLDYISADYSGIVCRIFGHSARQITRTDFVALCLYRLSAPILCLRGVIVLPRSAISIMGISAGSATLREKTTGCIENAKTLLFSCR